MKISSDTIMPQKYILAGETVYILGKINSDCVAKAVVSKEFYNMLYSVIMEGKDLEITSEMASEVIRVIEICHAQKPLPVKF